MSVLELETKEGTYIINNDKEDYHFAIDCICSSKKGSQYKNATAYLEIVTINYTPDDEEDKYRHTFYMNEVFFLEELSTREAERKGPLIIVCNNCSREFTFTHASYLELKGRIIVSAEKPK